MNSYLLFISYPFSAEWQSSLVIAQSDLIHFFLSTSVIKGVIPFLKAQSSSL